MARLKKKDENQEQRDFFKLVAITYPEPTSMLIWGNISGINLNARKGMLQRLQGYRAGTPDIAIMIPRGKYHGLFIELKKQANKILGQKKGVLSEKQKIMLAELEKNGYRATVAYGAAEAFEILKEYLEK